MDASQLCAQKKDNRRLHFLYLEREAAGQELVLSAKEHISYLSSMYRFFSPGSEWFLTNRFCRVVLVREKSIIDL